MICVLAVFSLAFLTEGSADDLNRSQLATGKPDHELSGIDVHATGYLLFATDISQVTKRLGPPTSTEIQKGSFASDKSGESRTYVWAKNGIRIQARTDVSKNAESGVYSVDAWGNGSENGLGATGRGLALGATFQRQKAIYGNRFYASSVEKGQIKSVLIQWGDGTQLFIDYGPDQRIRHMQLMAAVE